MRHARTQARARTSGALLAAAIPLMLAGCIPTGPASTDPPRTTVTASEPGSTPGASPTPAPGPSAPPPADAPTATPAALPCPAYDDGLDVSYVAIDSHRFASVCVGMTLEDASAALPGAAVTPHEQCPWVGAIAQADPLYIEAITDPEHPGGAIRFFRMVYLDDPKTAPPDDMPATAEAVSIGSVRGDVTTAYPAAIRIVQDDPSRGPREQLVVEEAPGHWYVFDLVGDVVAEVTWGQGLGEGIAGELCAL